MNKFITFNALCAVMLAFLLSGCLEQSDVPICNGPYIQSYYSGALAYEVLYYENTGPGIYFMAISTDDEEAVNYTAASTGKKKAVYDSLCQKHFDYGYHGPDVYANEIAKNCYSKDIVSISIVSDKAYDDQHPAGSSLADVVVYNAVSPYRWIKGGYQGDPVFSRTRNYLSLVTGEDMTLLCAYNLFYLTFFKEPTSFSRHIFTVTVVTDDGMEYVFNNVEVLF